LSGNYAAFVGKKHLSLKNQAVELKSRSFLKFALAPSAKLSIMRPMPTGWCESETPGEFEESENGR
jgi:hypothetical protein